MTKIPGKRYAYKFDFTALKMSCEAQQNPMPSDTKEGDLHAIMASVMGPEDNTSEQDSIMSPEHTASDADYINSPPSDGMQEYEELELAQSRLTPPPPYPGTTNNSYHTDLNTYGSSYQDYGVYGHSSIVSGSGGHASIVDHSQPQQSDGPCYQDLVTVAWTQSSQDCSWTASFRQSTNTLEEFDLSFLTGDNLQESQNYYGQGPAS